MPDQIAFRMTLHPGQAAEYEKRHDEIFPELVDAPEGRRASRTTRSGSTPRATTCSASSPAPTTTSMDDAARPRGHEALVGLHVRHHGQPPDNSPVQMPLKQVFYLP